MIKPPVRGSVRESRAAFLTREFMTAKGKLKIFVMLATTAAVTFAAGYYTGVVQMAAYVREALAR